MKTTLDIPDDLFREAKAKAALEGRRLTDLVTEGLEAVLNKRVPPRKKLSFPLRGSKRKKPLSLPDDVATRAEIIADFWKYEASLRQ